MKSATLSSAAKLIGYYAILVAAFLGIERLAPVIGETLSMARLRALSGALDLERAGAGLGDPPGVFVAVLAALGALALAIPVAWVYRTTKPRERLDVAVLQTVIVLPVAVAGIVLIVQNSLALAFSLAGIVAAVRFRNTLKDTKDAVYIFVAIGLGLAAGVQALGVGLVISLAYGLVMLAVSQLEMAPAPEPDRDRRPRVAGTLVVETGDDTGQKTVEGVLEEHARRWKLVRRAPAEGGRTALAYAVRLRRKTTPAALVRDLRRAGPAMSAVEFETLED